ncbi:MAG: TrkH family potassium uptake protein [Sneathiellaceae bacterium]
MKDLRPVFAAVGALLCILSAAMLLPAIVDAEAGNDNWVVFLISALLTLFFAVSMILAASQSTGSRITVRQTFILTTLSWVLMSGFAAIPFAIADIGLGPVDALFEAMSGITTTGATVMTDLSGKPPGILLWRAILQWIGGVGIIVMSLAVLPMLQIGGMQLFRTESSDKLEKILPRATQFAANIGGIYLGLTLLCIVAYYIAGMGLFDAVCHALTTLSTGGFSTYDASIGHFASPAIEWTAVFFMLVGGISFGTLVMAVNGRPRIFLKDSQLHWFLGACLVATVIVALWVILNVHTEVHRAIRETAFSVVAIVTGTGYAATDYGLWGAFSHSAFFALMFLGGCTGSTTGGIKVFRFQILFITMRRQFFSLVHPHGVRNPTYNGQTVPAEVAVAVTSFFFLYGLSVMVVAILLGMFGLDFLTAISASAAAVGNVGPGLGDLIGPSGNYASIPDGAKMILAFAMLLGRLELFTVLVLFNPEFWRG